MSGSPIKFGTDGWRAIIADEFTFANVRACAQAAARYFREAGAATRGIVVGYDTRFASEEFAAGVVEVLAAAGGRMPREEATAKGLVQKFDPRADYLRHLGQLVEIERLRQPGLRVVVDPMHGAGAGYLRELLSGGRTEVIEIRSERNPAFPGMHNPEPIARNLEATREADVQAKAQVALAADG